MPSVQYILDDERQLFVRTGKTFIVVHHDVIEAQAMAVFKKAILQAAEIEQATNPGGCLGLLIIMPHHLRPPEAKARKIASELFSAVGKHLRCALVLEGRGFMASTVRSVFTGIVTLSGRVSGKTFGAIVPGCTWLEKELGLQPASLAPVATMLRARSVPDERPRP